MRRDCEEVRIYAGRKTVWDVCLESVPVGLKNLDTRREVKVQIMEKGETSCEDYGKIMWTDSRIDDIPVKRTVIYPDEIRIYV